MNECIINFRNIQRVSVSFSLDELSQDVLENTTVLEVSDFNIGIESDLNLEGLASAGGDVEDFVDLESTSLEINVESFLTVQAEGISVLSVDEFSGENTHTDQVRSVDSFVALSNDGLDTLKVRSPAKI